MTLGDEGEVAAFCLPVEGDTVAIIGQNRKLLVFALDEVPVMAKGRGVILQKYKDGGVSDIKVFTAAFGLSYLRGEQIRTENDLGPWLAARGTQGKLPPTGFPRSNRFDG